MCPLGQCFVNSSSSPIGKGDPAGKEPGRCGLIAGAVFVVTHQRETTAGELDSNLMAAAGVEAYMDKAGFIGGKRGRVGGRIEQTFKFQPSLFDSFAFSIDYKNFIFSAVFE